MSKRMVFLLVPILICILTGCSQVTPTVSLDDVALKYLREQGKADVSTAVDILNALANDRKEEAEQDKDTSMEEIPTEERITIEEIRNEIASQVAPTGVLTPWKVTTLMDSEVPKLRRLYSDTIIIGNSRARSILDSKILTDNEVLFKWAAHVDEMMDTTLQGANLHRGKTLFILGVNDLGYYTSNTAGFKRDYIALIDAYREINPDSEIYIQEIIPINEAYRFRWYNMDRVTDYNAVIREICEEKDCTFVTSVYYAIPEFLRDDGTGAHYNYQYHIYWAQTMANQMNLWEDQE